MENQGGKHSGFYSRKLKAGKRRTYFFDVRDTKQGDFYLTITESKKKFDGDGYESHKVFLYKEDFKKFIEALNDTISHIKELMPDFDYDADRTQFVKSENEELHENNSNGSATQTHHTPKQHSTSNDNVSDYETPNTSGIGDDEEVKW